MNKNLTSKENLAKQDESSRRVSPDGQGGSGSLFLLTRVAINGLLVVLNVLAVDALGSLGGVAEDTGAADSLIFHVVESSEELAVGTVHVRFTTGKTDDVEDIGGLVEDAVHFFQGAACGLGEEEVDNGDDSGITGRRKVSVKCE